MGMKFLKLPVDVTEYIRQLLLGWTTLILIFMAFGALLWHHRFPGVLPSQPRIALIRLGEPIYLLSSSEYIAHKCLWRQEVVFLQESSIH